MAARTGMVSLVNHLRQQGEASATDVFNDVTYWTDDQLQDILDLNSQSFKTMPLTKLGLYDDVSYTMTFTLPFWVEGGFSIYVRDTTILETETYTYNHLTHEVTFDADVDSRDLIVWGKVYIMTEALADLWNQKAQHRKDYITFKAGAHRMEGAQVYNHCVAMSHYWRNLRVRSFKRSSNRFVRYE